jgi:hypothetical protein
MQYDIYFEICEWNVYFYQSVVQHTGYPAKESTIFLYYQLSERNKRDCYISSMTYWKWSGIRKERSEWA